jgi:hypothetical protein
MKAKHAWAHVSQNVRQISTQWARGWTRQETQLKGEKGMEPRFEMKVSADPQKMDNRHDEPEDCITFEHRTARQTAGISIS